jgi:lysylphosphatidylglycerol synthetase-like protein (DUF2156 family)
MDRSSRRALGTLLLAAVGLGYMSYASGGVMLSAGDEPLMTGPYIGSVRVMATVALVLGAAAYLLMAGGVRGARQDTEGLAFAGISASLGVLALVSGSSWLLTAFMVSLIVVWLVGFRATRAPP